MVRRTYRRVGAARGQARYLAGAGIGTVAIVLIAAAAAAIISSVAHTVWLGAIAGGALGALLSVLERHTRGALHVRFESDRLMLSGFTRPVVGAITGIALFALVEAGIVPLDVPDGQTGRGLFLAGIAFVGGFSERLARDVFGNAAASIPGAEQAPAAAQAEEVAAPDGERSAESSGSLTGSLDTARTG